MKKPLILMLMLIAACSMNVNSQNIKRVEPPCWWVGMKNPRLQLMIYGSNINQAQVGISDSRVTLESVDKTENPNYLFLNLAINENAEPGAFNITFKFPKGKPRVVAYELKERKQGSSERIGFNNSDVIYLVFPDRFSNGNPANDSIKGFSDKYNRNDPYGRHGGDIQGIINHLDYFNQLGVTALWLNPILENNQPSTSYHGYAITDFYKVDPRLGDNELYRKFSQMAHERGLKVVKDMVFNHCGSSHWWMNDLPMHDWINQFPQFTRTNYRIPTTFDPHASTVDSSLMADGWFDLTMPDLNQRNPYMATYLIQNSIWWIEYADLNGIRMDTHPYCDKHFMSRWCAAVMSEYPNFSIVGETWVNYPDWVAYWQKDAHNQDGYNSNLKVAMDFPLMFAMHKAFDEKDGWDTGLARLYEILAHDFVYPSPNNLLIFADNHDIGRFHRDSSLALGRLKLAMAFLLTTRGIPEIYYGTEIILPGDDAKGHGDIRRDFPGGWEGDLKSAFTTDGRTNRQNEIFNYISTILNWRKTASAVHSGKLTHFIPENEVYVYFRFDDKQTVMVILNNGYQPKMLETARFSEMMKGKNSAVDIISGKVFDNLEKIQLSPRSALILELR
ncbi:MAG TPA: glycoside hydrolase family 13 protein [Tenuifilaceae bacterium]|nr:glycoside hydrolase family 13 protein [Tenuifilaceae bacterium]HOG71883.1 glycoside hydrolase family 13 protein [Tenuifilaceae bacterium]HPA66911.1 glycoside hydrolase family 13 protein [Tenuifilaceae bacterium]HPM89191.1 glycoside hydrolase family 13 protein [Tenuifilaceae bacterium]HQN83269.1 glycoside hydrolase family 13 protein [Tenuifilaceae bacterium]